jgi:hypothetical protein
MREKFSVQSATLVGRHTVLKSSREFSVGDSHVEFVVEEELEVGL